MSVSYIKPDVCTVGFPIPHPFKTTALGLLPYLSRKSFHILSIVVPWKNTRQNRYQWHNRLIQNPLVAVKVYHIRINVRANVSTTGLFTIITLGIHLPWRIISNETNMFCYSTEQPSDQVWMAESEMRMTAGFRLPARFWSSHGAHLFGIIVPSSLQWEWFLMLTTRLELLPTLRMRRILFSLSWVLLGLWLHTGTALPARWTSCTSFMYVAECSLIRWHLYASSITSFPLWRNKVIDGH
jgi:hypothetical protein